ncbi:MAG: response regulator [Elusimicrobia bacterium]|nr:response regulator [Elusimicrobiota bacterium]
MPQKKLILVIEDEEVIASMLKDNLEQMGYEVMVAGSGMEGLRRAEYLKPDIITLDVMMPGLDGIQVLKKLKDGEDTKNIPVLLVSVAGDTERTEGLKLGAVDFFKKPLDFQRLHARIKSLTNKETIMVVENEEEILKLIEHKLVSMGYKVIGISDGDKVFSVAKEKKPDMILLDYLLPKRDGFEIIEDIKKHKETADIPVIVFSGYIYEDLSEKKIIGVNKFLGKQFSVEELAKEVDDALREKSGTPGGDDKE